MPDAPMTENDLAEIEARCEEATPGPWERYVTYVFSSGESGANILAASELRARTSVGYTEPALGSPDRREIGANAEFAAHARTDVPALAAALRRSWAENADLKAKVQQLQRELVNAQIASGEWNP